MSDTPTHLPSTEAAVEREIRLLLMRHLPANLQGIGLAQSRAVIEMLRRRTAHDFKVVIDDDFRRGLGVLARLAADHVECWQTLNHDPTARAGCAGCPGTALTRPGHASTDPCPLREAARLMGVAPREGHATPAAQPRTVHSGKDQPIHPLETPRGRTQ